MRNSPTSRKQAPLPLTAATKPVFQGLSNFRDLGDLPLADGRHLKTGRWFRSDALAGLTDADLDALRRLRLKTVCDLRTPEESRTQPDRLPPGSRIQTVHVPIYHQVTAFLRTDYIDCLGDSGREAAFVDSLRVFYHKMAMENHRELSQILALAMAEERLPVLIHCTGGKDRTGFACAVLALLAGVPREAVMEDFLASNRVIAPRMQVLIDERQLEPDQWRPMIDVYPEYLDHALDAVAAKYGSLEAYYVRALGGSEAKLQAFRAAAAAPIPA